MVAGLHQALIQALQQETCLPVLASQLRALQTLVLAAPYHRLPARILASASEVRFYAPCTICGIIVVSLALGPLSSGCGPVPCHVEAVALVHYHRGGYVQL